MPRHRTIHNALYSFIAMAIGIDLPHCHRADATITWRWWPSFSNLVLIESIKYRNCYPNGIAAEVQQRYAQAQNQ
jgi:hypothetical protein